ncbi:branched-chain amino acid ABC transporter permease [soil metagenome]
MPLLAIATDFLTSEGFWIGVGVLAGTYALVALGLQLNAGYSGLINFGMAGFMAIGAYAMAILTIKAEWSFWLALPASALITIMFGLLIGLPSLRLRADYFAIATIASSEVIRQVAQNARGLTGGNEGLFCDDSFNRCYDDSWNKVSGTISGWLQDLGWSNPDSLAPLLIVVWITVLVVGFGLSRITNTPWGRVLRAVREDEDAARDLGKNAFAYKLQSLAIAAFIGAIAGWFLALNLATIHPMDYEPIVTFYAYGVLLLGGLASYRGVAFGAIVFWAILEGTRFIEIFSNESQATAFRFFIVGILIIGLMVFRPQGMFGKKEEMVLGE